MCDTIRKHIGAPEQILVPTLPGDGEVAVDVEGDEAELLLNVVDDEGLFHDVDGAEGDEFLEVVGEGLAAQVNPPHGIIEREVVKDGGGVDEGEPCVHDEAALSPGEKPTGPACGLVEVD